MRFELANIGFQAASGAVSVPVARPIISIVISIQETLA